MGSTFGPEALPYPQPTDQPDGPGAFLALVQALMTGGPVAQDTFLHLQAVAGKFLYQRGVVYNDSTPTNNGDYVWNGTSWARPGSGPYFRYHRAAAFNWTSSIQAMQWDTLADGTLEGMTLAAGVFTCQTAGLWEFDGRIGITTGTSSANIRWYRNGSPDIEFANGQSSSGFLSAGGVYRKVLAVGDTVAMEYITAAASATGITIDGTGNQVTWLTARYLGTHA